VFRKKEKEKEKKKRREQTESRGCFCLGHASLIQEQFDKYHSLKNKEHCAWICLDFV